ncbi:response regulator [Pseudobacteriovorax antillogorgiicola]|uniref:response regulator n=1 Tax=Pseudobacteriovorax antillogorgiicola TaxID=1513793 RepID=UPI001356304B|nr:response regulator [Pseudobacteriovorax antillogorgiicola]
MPKRVLIVEDDKSMQSLIQSAFRDNGIMDVFCVSDGEEAWKQLHEYKFDLMTLDWKLPVLHGMQLFNRIRQDRRLRNLPIVVISGFLDHEDHVLTEDYFFTASLSKPFDEDKLMKISKEILRDRFDYQKILQRAETAYFEDFDRNIDKPTEIINVWLQNMGQNPKGVSMAASIIRSLNGVERSISMIMDSLKIHPTSSLLLHQLAMSQLMSGDFDSARTSFQKANNFCSHNLERILWLGELELHRGNCQAGIEYFQKALSHDTGSPTIQKDLELANLIKEKLAHYSVKDLENGLGSFLNSLAIEKVRRGQYEDGEGHYEKALCFSGNVVAKAKLYYNMGICEARQGRRSEAVSYFFRSVDLLPDYNRSIEALRKFGYDIHENAA